MSTVIPNNDRSSLDAYKVITSLNNYWVLKFWFTHWKWIPWSSCGFHKKHGRHSMNLAAHGFGHSWERITAHIRKIQIEFELFEPFQPLSLLQIEEENLWWYRVADSCIARRFICLWQQILFAITSGGHQGYSTRSHNLKPFCRSNSANVYRPNLLIFVP